MNEAKQILKERRMLVKRKNSRWVEISIAVLVVLKVWELFETEIRGVLTWAFM